MTGLITSIVLIAVSILILMTVRVRTGLVFSRREAAHVPESCDELITEIRAAMSRTLFDDRPVPGLTDEDLLSRERRRERLRKATLESCLGDRGEREYVKSFIRDHLSRELKLTDEDMMRIIPSEAEGGPSRADKFELLYALFSRTYPQGVFGEMVRSFEWHVDTGIITDEDIDEAYALRRDDIDYSDRLEFLVQRCYEMLYGHDCTDLLISDSSVDGVSAGVGGLTRTPYDLSVELARPMRAAAAASRSHEVVYCVFRGRLVRLKFLSFAGPAALERVVRNICRFNMRTALSQKDPVLCGSLKDNSRVVAARPPVSDGWSFYVRKFTSSSPADISSLLVHDNSDAVIFLLKALIGAEFNFVISGNTGGGKTTLLKSLVSFIDPRYTLRVVETSFELNLNNLYPERNIHVLQERGGFSVYDAVTATKKMDTDVLIIGEVNEPKIAGAYIQVAQSGSRMALTTLHHETTEGLVAYLRNALVAECGMSDVTCAENQVIDVLRFDVHMVHDIGGNHYVERITEIIPREEMDSLGKEDRSFSCRNIVEFDRKTMSYKMAGYLSRKSIERISGRLGQDRAEELGRVLCNMNYSSV